ncbi:MAG: hypothetical protein JXA22_07795 [Candidatus Thermoplasmatota archaeon]|nr:hypothetical protein [Candidatus Thermoplasmatota archaeon]
MHGKSLALDRLMMMAGIIALGSIWGLLECALGGIKLEIAGLPVSMGAVMAGLFGIGFMVLARKFFDRMGVSLGVALVAGIMRFFAPVGSCVICSAIAIMVEGLIFELILNRKMVLWNIRGIERDYRTLVFTGVISGFTIFSIGYILTQLLTPLFTEGILLPLSDLWGILPLIFGRAFYAALLGGVSLPAAMFVDRLHLDVNRWKKGVFYSVSGAISIFCWVMVLAVIF